MAIIKCPECEGKVSTEAQKCVHCGCSLTVCKECGSVFVGKLDVCTECGNSLKKKEVYENSRVHGESRTKEEDTGFSHVQSIYRQWREETGIKVYMIIGVVSLFLSGIFAVIALMRFFAAGEWGFEADSQQTLMITLFVFAAIFLFITCVIFSSGMRSLVSSLNFSKWMRMKRKNLDGFIIEYMESEGKNIIATDVFSQNATKDIMQARAIESDYKVRQTIINTNIIASVLSAVSCLFGSIFVIANVKNFSEIVWLVDMDGFFEAFEFSMIEYWWAFGIAIIAIVANMVYKAMAKSIKNRCIDDWFKKAYPDYYGDYDKYIRENLRF